jgi:hypothetical protein
MTRTQEHCAHQAQLLHESGADEMACLILTSESRMMT